MVTVEICQGHSPRTDERSDRSFRSKYGTSLGASFSWVRGLYKSLSLADRFPILALIAPVGGHSEQDEFLHEKYQGCARFLGLSEA